MLDRKKPTPLPLLSLFALMALVRPAAAQPALTMKEYLGQVQKTHEGLKAAAETSEGAAKRSEEGTLLLSPTLFGTFQYLDDKTPRLNPSFQGNNGKNTSYSLGVRKLTSFGLTGAFSYNVNRTQIFGALPQFTPLPDYYDSRPQLELSYSLWRNLFGAETRADQERLEAQALATSYEQSFRTKSILAEAEATYWRLATAVQAVEIQRRSLERAEVMRDWLAGQVRMQLTDRADLLQAVAAVRVRELELATARDNARIAATAFNTMRSIDSQSVDVELENFDPKAFAGFQVEPTLESRDDVKAAKERTRVAEAVAVLGQQRNSPDVQLFGLYALNGRATALGDSTTDSTTTKYPYANIGVRFTAPLGIPAILDARAGYRQEKVAADLAYDRTTFEAKQELVDLTKRLAEAQSRFRLANEIVTAQREKLDHERARHRRGRTTTYQVLLFEQDYATSQLSKLQIENDIVAVVARLKTFGGQSQ